MIVVSFRKIRSNRRREFLIYGTTIPMKTARYKAVIVLVQTLKGDTGCPSSKIETNKIMNGTLDLADAENGGALEPTLSIEARAMGNITQKLR
jgi:hypothetical protein